MASAENPPGTSPSNEDWANSYREARGEYESSTFKLHGLVEDLLRDAEVDVVQVDARTKEVDSFLKKLTRKRDSYSNPLRDITDLIGIRVITYYLEDVQEVSDLVKQEFNVDDTESVNKGEALDPDQFGYVSVHYVISLGETRRNLAEWSAFSGKRAEIQIRTATQHAWSAIEHKLSYKSEEQVPDGLKRRLSRLSALFELADEQFSQLRGDAERLDAYYATEFSRGNLMFPVNASSVEAYLDRTERISPLVDAAKEHGFGPLDASAQDDSEVDRDRADLIRALAIVGVETISEFDGLLAEAAEHAADFFATMRPEYEAANLSKHLLPENLLTMLAFGRRQASLKQMRLIYNHNAARAIKSAQGALS